MNIKSLATDFYRLYTINLRFYLWLCLFIGLHAQAAPSQAEQINTLLQLSLEELLEVEVIVASKSEQTTADTPSSVTVFTHQEIQNMGVTTLGELLDFVPGFQSFRLALNGDSQGFQVRGNPILPVFTRDVLLLRDGRRLNGSHSGGAVLYNVYLSLDNIKQVEVIRGPGSALYGSNAFLGVVNIISLDDHNAVTLRAGNHASKEALVHLSQQKNDWHIAAFARMYGDQGDDYIGLSDRTGRSGAASDSRHGADANLKLSRGDFNLYLHHTQRRIEDFLDSEYIGANGINNSENEQSSIAFDYSHAVSKQFNLQLSGGYTRSRLYFLSDAGLQSSGARDLFGLYLENDVYNIDITADWKIDSSRWQAGFTYENTGNTDNALIDNHSIDGRLRYLRGTEGFTDNRDRDILGLYVQQQYSLRSDLNLVWGLRYDRYSDFGSTFNPRGALIYTTPWQDRIKLMYGEAFRAPNLADLTLNVSNSKGNPNLQPEQISTIELAYVHTADYGQGILTLFNNHIRDVITIEPDATGQYFARNEGELKRSGMELEFQIEPFSDWLLRATYTRIFDDIEGTHAPQDFASLIINHHWQRWNVNLNGTYQAKIDSLVQPQNTWLANASIRYQFTPQITVQSTVYNIADKTYYDPSEFSALVDGRLRGVEPGIPLRGRTFWLGVEFSWN